MPFNSIIEFGRESRYIRRSRIERMRRAAAPEFREMIEGRRVVIVGPASYLMEDEKGAEIDGYDTVIRPNFTANLCGNHPEQFGTRTDIYSVGVRRHIIDNISSLDADKHVLFALPPLTPEGAAKAVMNYDAAHCLRQFAYCLNTKKLEKISYIPESEFLSFEDQLQAVPTTGITAVEWAAKLKPRELYITGFTLFKDDHPKGYDTEENMQKHRKANFTHPRHRPYKVLEFFQNLRRTHRDILKLDPELEEILSFDGQAYREEHGLHADDDETVFAHYLENA